MSILPTLAAWLHDLDPVLLDLPGPIDVRWYGLSYVLGFAIGYAILHRVAKNPGSPLKPRQVGDLVMALILGTVVGGRIGYVLFYEPSLLLEGSSTPPFWGALSMHRGGMASHGGMIGLLVGAIVFSRINGVDWRHVLDVTVLAGPLGVFLGRIANFINGELYGRPAPPDLGWAVKFPQELREMPAEVLSRLRERLAAEGALPAALAERMGVYRVAEWAIEQVQAGNATVIRVVESALTPRHPSQLYAAVLEGLVVFAVIAVVWAWPRRPLVPTGVFCVTYAVARIINEFYREPDAHIAHLEAQTLNVTRGQWLSAILGLVGVAMLIAAARRKDARVYDSWRMADQEVVEGEVVDRKETL